MKRSRKVLKSQTEPNNHLILHGIGDYTTEEDVKL